MTAAKARGAWLVGGAICASVALVATYLALGGASYAPSGVADPCEPREWRSPEGLDEVAEQFTLSALDGAACELRVTRERLALALATPASREAFAAEHGIDDTELEAAVRAGLERAVTDAEQAGAISPLIAAGLREVVVRLPIDEAITVIEDARELLAGAESGLGALERLVPDT